MLCPAPPLCVCGVQDWLQGDPLSDWREGRITQLPDPSGTSARQPAPGGALLAGFGRMHLGHDWEWQDLDGGGEGLQEEEDEEWDEEDQLADLAAFGMQAVAGMHGPEAAAHASWWAPAVIAHQQQLVQQQQQRYQGPPPPAVQQAAARDRPLEELLQADNAWLLSGAERQRLGQHLMREYLGQDGLLQRIADMDADLAEVAADLQVSAAALQGWKGLCDRAEGLFDTETWRRWRRTCR